MKVQVYLVINNRGTIKVKKNKPFLNNDEIAIRINLEIPKSFFERIIPTVDLKIPESEIMNNPDWVITETSREISEKLKLDFNEVKDGLSEMVNKNKSND